MKDNYLIHNLYWEDIKRFEEFDPHLSKLKKQRLIYESDLITEIPVLTPGIYILTGGRQVGKTTLIKSMIRKLLTAGKMLASELFYLPCDTIENFRELLFEIEQFKNSLNFGQRFILFLDEISYVKEWPRAVKHLADAGFFEYGSTLITGSDTFLLKSAMMEFPGRRGRSNRQDFHLYPLSFYEYVKLNDAFLSAELFNIKNNFPEISLSAVQLSSEQLLILEELFQRYLLTGGYLLAINDLLQNETILDSTYATYRQWVIGDILKRGKNESFLREIIKAIIPRLSRQLTWQSFSQNLSIEHHQTVIDYISILERMDVITILPALDENRLAAAPKKAKKVSFGDPFIFHSLNNWLTGDFYERIKKALASDVELKNNLIEGVIASLAKRRWGEENSYYIKAEGEVDLAVIKNRKKYPIEIKNSKTLRSADLKQILKYESGFIGYGGLSIGRFSQLDVLPIPLLAVFVS